MKSLREIERVLALVGRSVKTRVFTDGVEARQDRREAG